MIRAVIKKALKTRKNCYLTKLRWLRVASSAKGIQNFTEKLISIFTTSLITYFTFFFFSNKIIFIDLISLNVCVINVALRFIYFFYID